MQTEPSVGSAGGPMPGEPAAGAPVPGATAHDASATSASASGASGANRPSNDHPSSTGADLSREANGVGNRGPRKPGPRRATARFMLSHPCHLISLGFGSGLSPVMPGTMGTLFAWASFAAFAERLTVIEWGILIIAGFFGGIAICGFTANRLGIDDPSPVVWDEIVAFWLVLLLVTPVSLTGQLWAFVLFRFFDMVKPPPIRYFDRRLKGGFGIMFDDLVAAFFTLLVIALWRMAV